MQRPKLTIGMAVYDDFGGVYFTLQALRTYHREVTEQVEFLVVDNLPGSAASPLIRGLVEGAARHGSFGARYIPFPDVVGTSAPRNKVFSEAAGEAVVCMDSHVLLRPGAVARLIEWYDDHPDSIDLVSGPLIYDDLVSGATHFDDVWRAEMWGVWGGALRCTWCSGHSPHTTPHSPLFSVQPGPDGATQYRALAPGLMRLDSCPRCGRSLPLLAFDGCHAKLAADGFVAYGLDPAEHWFEVPGQGLGLFSCRREAWLGFNEHFREFGGEELYIHEKFRRAGGKNLCLPFLGWGHRFGRPGGAKFPISRYAKVRNYVIGHQELDLPLEPVHEHFVASGLMSEEQWQYLLADPIGHDKLTGAACGARRDATRPMPPEVNGDPPDPEAILAWCRGVPRDIEQHLDKLADLAAQCNTIVEFSGRRESMVGLLAGVARERELGGLPFLMSHNTDDDPLPDVLAERFSNICSVSRLDSPAVPEIPRCDLLFLDTLHTADRVYEELSKFGPSVNRWIVLHDTESYGPSGEGGGPGLHAALSRYTAENPEWFVAWHTPAQYGLTVLSRDPADRPERTIWLWPPADGPGTELKAILKTLGIDENTACDCNAKAIEMDKWGVAGCRENFDTIVGWMREGQTRWGWADKLKAAAKAVATGLAFEISWSDPFPDLVRLAIDRADETSNGS